MKTFLAIIGLLSVGVGGYALGHYHGTHPRRRYLLPPLRRRG